MDETEMKKMIESSELLRKAGNYEEAIKICNEIIAQDAQCYLAYSQRSYIFHRMSNWDKAFADLEMLIALRPSCPAAYFTRARWNFERGHYSSSIEDSNVVVNSGEFYFLEAAHFFRSLALLKTGRQQDALSDAQKLAMDFKYFVKFIDSPGRIITRDDLLRMIDKN